MLNRLKWLLHPKIKIGKNLRVGEGTIIGGHSSVTTFDGGRRVVDPDYGYWNNEGIIIGDNVTIGSNALINFGWKAPTIIEDNVMIGNYTSVAHDAILRKNACLVSGIILGGHTEVGEWSFIAPMCYTSPFVKIGRNCYIGPKSNVTKDVPDYSFGFGNPYRVLRENTWRPPQEK